MIDVHDRRQGARGKGCAFPAAVLLAVFTALVALVIYPQWRAFTASPVENARPKLLRSADELVMDAGAELTGAQAIASSSDSIRKSFAEQHGSQVFASRVTQGQVQWDVVLVTGARSRDSWTYDGTVVGTCFRLVGRADLVATRVDRTDFTCPADLINSPVYGTYEKTIHLPSASVVVRASPPAAVSGP